MRVRCQHFGREMAEFTASLNLNEGNQSSEEKLELVKKFVEFLESDECRHKHKMEKRGHGRHGMFGRFGKHGSGMYHGHHGHHHGSHGRHGHRHGNHGPHHYGRHGYHHHHHGFHGRNGKFKAHWIIDLTEDEQEVSQRVIENDCNTGPSQEEGACNTNENESAAMRNKCCRFDRRRCGRSGRWMPCPYKRNVSKDNYCQTDEAMAEDNDNEQPQENLSTMVENINIENTE